MVAAKKVKVAAKRREKMKWEYRVLSFEAKGFWRGGGKVDKEAIQDALNELGGEGWELVNAFGTSKNVGETRDIIAIFKRQG